MFIFPNKGLFLSLIFSFVLLVCFICFCYDFFSFSLLTLGFVCSSFPSSLRCNVRLFVCDFSCFLVGDWSCKHCCSWGEPDFWALLSWLLGSPQPWLLLPCVLTVLLLVGFLGVIAPPLAGVLGSWVSPLLLDGLGHRPHCHCHGGRGT